MEERYKVGNVCEMELHQVLHMNGGEKGDNSYANNSLIQKKVLLLAKPILQECMMELCTKSLSECITFADMGCSSGPNAFIPMQEIINTIDETCHRLNKKPPTLQVFLNDLPGNDFNSIFKSLPSFQKKLEEERGGSPRPCFIAAMPGNFYGRLFPPHSLHFVLSTSSLHWLSKIPKFLLDKRQIYVTKTSPPKVYEAYLGQFEKDFSSFLRCRSEEVIPGGKMVLSMCRREDNDFKSETCSPTILELFDTILNHMVDEGMIDESKLHSFNIPFYFPSSEEVENVIRKEGSFKINRIEPFQTAWDACVDNQYKGLVDKLTKGKFVAKCWRAILESILVTHFGGDIIDVMFERFSNMIGDCIEIVGDSFTLVVSMTKE